MAQVSKSTVSQYLNGRYNYMSEKTKERIKETIEELEYQENYIAKSLRQKKTSTIGVVIANIVHSFSTQVIRAIEDVCNAQDIHVILCNADDNPIKEKKYIDILRAKQVDGLIVFPTDGNIDLYHQTIKEQYPLVFIDREVKGISVETFLLDNQNATKMAVDHLIERKHSRISLITTSLVHSVTPRFERIEGYKNALATHGLTPKEEYINGCEVQNIKDALSKMLSFDKPPTALIAGNDLTLMEVLKYVNENNIKVPDELAIIGIDDVSFANIYSPTLTTIAQPAYEMGEKAAKHLINTIESIEQGGDIGEPSVNRFKGELIIRQST